MTGSPPRALQARRGADPGRDIAMFNRLFVDHPTTVGETYLEHFGVASSFGVAMIRGGLCALVHAFVPGWCITSASDTIQRLNAIMVEKRRAKAHGYAQINSVDWVI
jgi:hypothetical protein